MLYARSVRLAKNVEYQLTPPSQATRSYPGKARSYELNILNETMLPMRRTKSLTISYTQYSTPPPPTPNPFQSKRKNGDVRKK